MRIVLVHKTENFKEIFETLDACKVFLVGFDDIDDLSMYLWQPVLPRLQAAISSA